MNVYVCVCMCAHVHTVREVRVLGKPGTYTDGPADPFSLALESCLSFLADLLLSGFCFSLMSNEKTELAKCGKDTRDPDDVPQASILCKLPLFLGFLVCLNLS